jgi:hypothetical protein
MRKDALINTNPYLRDSRQRETLLVRTIISSTAVEGVNLDFAEVEKSLSISGKHVRLYASSNSSRSQKTG